MAASSTVVHIARPEMLLRELVKLIAGIGLWFLSTALVALVLRCTGALP